MNVSTSLRVPAWLILVVTLAAGMSSPVSIDRSAARADEGQAATPETAPTAGPGVVTGLVVRADDGAPVAGALVLLRDRQLFKATTDEVGRFLFKDIPPGQFALWAHKDDLASPKVRLVGEKGDKPETGVFPDARLTMEPGKQVRFKVTSDVTGAPLKEADIRFGYPDRRQTTTDGAGVAAVRALLPEKYEVRVEAAGHARQSREIDLADSGQILELSFRLPAGGAVRGVVLDESGRPLEKAGVTYYTGDTSYWDHGTAFATDSEGKFSHLNLPLGRAIKISVRLQDYLPEEREVTLTDRRKEEQLEIRLKRRPPGGSIAGIVTGLDGKPVAGATIRNFGRSSSEKREATTDAEGRYVLHDLLKRGTRSEIIVRADKFAPALRAVKPGTEESPEKVDIQLQAGHSVRGVVQNPQGEPIKGAYVSANGYGDDGIGETVRTTDDGKFEFDSLPENTKFMFQATDYPIVMDEELKLDGAEPVIVVLEPSVALRGRVVDADSGVGLKEFRVRVNFSQQRKPGDAQGTYPSSLSEPGLTIQSKDGTFAVNGLKDGMPLEVVVEAEGYEREVFPRVVPTSDEGAEANPLQKVAMKKRDLSKLASLIGTIVTHKSQPAAGVQLRLIVTPKPMDTDKNRFNWALIDSGQLGRKSYVDQYLSTTTDAEGKFEFKGLLPDRFLQLVYFGDAAPKGRWLEFEQTKAGAAQVLTLKLPEPATLSGSFDASFAEEIAEVQAYFLEESFLVYSQRFESGKAARKFEFRNLPPGEYQLTLQAHPVRVKENPQMLRSRPLASRKLTIEPGSAHEVKFTKDDALPQRQDDE